ncbi:MAG: acyl-CoA dehydrogenase family protein [Spirochaetales bacterium]|nr:acyl-CoA dehydrogenase family protein [Spirochaetales bacterium]
MNYFLTEEQRMIKDLAAQIAREKIEPVAIEYDEKQTFPRDIVKIMGQSDLFGVFIPEEYNGLGGGVFEMCLVIEELSKACGGIALAYAASALGTIPIIYSGNEEQKKRYLPKLAAGEIIAAFAFAEPDTADDATAIKTHAVPAEDHYVLNGKKHYTTNGGDAFLYTVIAMTDSSPSALLVEKDTPGFTFGENENKMGIRASSTRELIFQDCKTAKKNLLGKEGEGLSIAAKTIDRFKPGVAAQAVGIAAGALNKALQYSREREQRGQLISEFQGIRFILADMVTQIEAARALTYQAARTIDAGEENISGISSMAKLFASDAAMKVTTDAVQIYGGYGYMKEYPVEKMMRDAKMTQIYEGTNQVQKQIIALELLKESAGKK